MKAKLENLLDNLIIIGFFAITILGGLGAMYYVHLVQTGIIGG